MNAVGAVRNRCINVNSITKKTIVFGWSANLRCPVTLSPPSVLMWGGGESLQDWSSPFFWSNIQSSFCHWRKKKKTHHPGWKRWHSKKLWCKILAQVTHIFSSICVTSVVLVVFAYKYLLAEDPQPRMLAENTHLPCILIHFSTVLCTPDVWCHFWHY